MIQAIVYDAVGTLIHPRPSVAALYAAVGRRFDSTLDEATIAARFGPAFAVQDRIDADALWRTSEERERRRWRAIVAQVLDDVTDQAGCFDELFAAFGRSDAWTCDSDADNVLTRLHLAGYRQALASNFDRRLHAVIAPMPISPLFEHIVVSSEVGWRKPAPEFFVHLAGRLRLPPDAILFIGDDVANDYEPARLAGMHALLLDPGGRHRDIATRRIERLRDIRAK